MFFDYATVYYRRTITLEQTKCFRIKYLVKLINTDYPIQYKPKFNLIKKVQYSKNSKLKTEYKTNHNENIVKMLV